MIDRPTVAFASRVVLPLAVLLGLVWSGSGAPPTTPPAPPAQAAVGAAVGAPGGAFGGRVHLVLAAGRHAQRNRRAPGSVAVLAASAAVIVVAARLRSRPARAGRLNRRLPAARPRAPPSLPA